MKKYHRYREEHYSMPPRKAAYYIADEPIPDGCVAVPVTKRAREVTLPPMPTDSADEVVTDLTDSITGIRAHHVLRIKNSAKGVRSCLERRGTATLSCWRKSFRRVKDNP